MDEFFDTLVKKIIKFESCTDEQEYIESQLLNEAWNYFEKIQCIVVITNNKLNNVELVIRDKKDIKILKSAILSSADIFISGDKDFIGNKNILTLTPAQFLSNYNC